MTRVLNIQQAEWALRQCDFDLVLIASDQLLTCLTDVQHVRACSTLPLLVLLPSHSDADQSAVLQAGADELICDNTPREALWCQTENWLSKMVRSPEQ